MEKQTVLLDTKKEYIEHLLDIFTIPIAKRIYKIFNDNNMNIKKFQEELVLIKIWNNNRVIEEYNEIIKKTKCKYLDKILKKIIYLDIKIKIDFDINLDDISIIKPHDFIHKCLINSAVFCWKNVYLFSSKNLKPSEKQYHLNLIEKNIRKIIKNTIRNIIPYEYILNLYEEHQSKLKQKKTKKEIVKQEEEDDEDDDEDEDDEDEDDDDEDEDDDDEEDDDDDEDEDEDEEDDDDDDEDEDEDDEDEDEDEEEVKIEKDIKIEDIEMEEVKEEIKEEVKEEEIKEEEIKEEIKEEEIIEEVKEEIKKEEVKIENDDLESLLEDDNDFIDTSIFKKKIKKKNESSDDESELDSESEKEENTNEIKRINITNINKKNRH